VRVCRDRERIELPGGDAVTMIPSRHGRVMLGRVPFPGEVSPDARLPLKMRDYRLGRVFMPKLEIGKKVFMHAGSADFLEEELEGHQCDVLFLCVAGWKKMHDYATRLPGIVKPKVIVPFHYDDFSRPLSEGGKVPMLPLQDLPGLLERLSKGVPDVEVRLVQPFEVMNF